MKKGKFLLLTLICSFLMPLVVNAAEKVPVYIFRGEGCGFCARALSFFEELSKDKEYKDLYELVEYEVWNDESNRELAEKVAENLGEEFNGVPYIIIGEKTFDGYASSYDEDIKKAIKDLYNTEEDKRVDKVSPIAAGGAYNATSENSSTSSDTNDADSVIAVIIILVAIAGFGYIIYLSRKDTPEPQHETKKKHETVKEEVDLELDEDDNEDDEEEEIEEEKETVKEDKEDEEEKTSKETKEEKKEEPAKKKPTTTKTKTTKSNSKKKNTNKKRK